MLSCFSEQPVIMKLLRFENQFINESCLSQAAFCSIQACKGKFAAEAACGPPVGIKKEQHMKKVELLAPAGNYTALEGAINAGADAIYLGGEQYGARAYADNFTQDEICAGIRMAHVFGRKIYLTVNTLVKEEELRRLPAFLQPLYEAGLDGVILQDLGALRCIRSYFPGLKLHASTQMTLTGKEGVSFVKKEGICRIVPARELSLEELKELKKETGVEVEAFIHGAMCYCYSGQCLFSSILGGRSGNRGRCAQPCRLPYEAGKGRQQYLLSMRDMCTIHLIPELIDAGIDSFKIEGRMKNPAYGAGVTAVYRKYIDLYYQDKDHYQVDRQDLKVLESLYIRSEIGEGYYHDANGKKMISLSSPAYSPTEEALLSSIREKYMDKKPGIDGVARLTLKEEEPAELLLQSGDTTVICRGDQVQKAVKQPLTREKVKEQLQKTGNSLIKIRRSEIHMTEGLFLPLKSVNELRRAAVAAMEDALISRNGLQYESRRILADGTEKIGTFSPAAVKRAQEDPKKSQGRQIHVSVRTTEQLEAALEAKVSRIYLDYSFFERGTPESLKHFGERAVNQNTAFYIAAPYIVRKKDWNYLEKIVKLFREEKISGVLVRNLESFGFLEKELPAQKLVLDANLYIWNSQALLFGVGGGVEFYLPLECNAGEWRGILASCRGSTMQASAVIYGRLPMMITANCLKKTMDRCDGKPEITQLKDRYKKQFPVYNDCLCCYNIIYNSLPLSLHSFAAKESSQAVNFRIDLTVEDQKESLRVILYFKELSGRFVPKGREEGENVPCPIKEYTTGHYKRGVE